MNPLCRVLLLLLCVLPFAGPGSAAAATALVASDLHFDPIADPALLGALAETDPAGWQAILDGSRQPDPDAYGKDTAWPLLRSALDAMQKAEPRPAVILIAGDLMAHGLMQRLEAGRDPAAGDRLIAATIAFIGAQFRRRFPDTPILPVVGNNDDDCGDYRITPGGPFLAETLDAIRGLARTESDPGVEHDWRAIGSYAVTPSGLPGLRILLLDTIFFSTHYKDSCGTGTGDPAKATLDWLAGQLEATRTAGQKAWLAYHIPPGIDAYGTLQAGNLPLTGCAPSIRPMWQEAVETRFEQLMAAYRDIVTANFAGHTHMDEFRVVGTADSPDAFVLGTPAISPIFGQNPGFRLVDFGADGRIAGIRTWFLADPAGSAAGWQQEYDFDAEWGLKAIDGKSLADLARRLSHDPAAANRWAELYSVSRPARKGGMTTANAEAYLCTLGHTDIPGFTACYCSGGSP